MQRFTGSFVRIKPQGVLPTGAEVLMQSSYFLAENLLRAIKTLVLCVVACCHLKYYVH